MSLPSQEMVRNRLLRAMPDDDYAFIRPYLSRAALEKDKTVIEPDKPIGDIYFVETGLGSVIAKTPGGEAAEVGLFGFDGLIGMPVVLGTDRSPHKLIMQIGGDGWRMDANRLREAIQRSVALHALLLRYIQFFLVQTAQTGVSNALHSVEERLARWILMSHDRMDGDDIPLTHDYLAVMLAVRRPSVTTSLHVLEGGGYIRATRGNIRMRDRAGLEEFAGEAYGTPEAEYARLISPLR